MDHTEAAKLKVKIGYVFQDTHITTSDGKLVVVEGITLSPWARIVRPEKGAPSQRLEEMDLTLIFGARSFEIAIEFQPGLFTPISQRNNPLQEGYARPVAVLTDPRYLAMHKFMIDGKVLHVRNFALVSNVERMSVSLSLVICPQSYEIEFPKE